MDIIIKSQKLDVISGMKKVSIKDFSTKCIKTRPEASKYIDECPISIKLTQIKESKYGDEKVVLSLEILEQINYTCAQD
jgi:hypothetical protein